MLKVFRKFLQNYCSKLFPKIITQNYNSSNLFPKIISQNYSAKQFPKPTSQNYCRKLLSEIVCKIAPESCSPKLLFFKIIILQYYSRKLAKTTPQSQNYSQNVSVKRLPQSDNVSNLVPGATPQRYSPKWFLKVAPQSWCRKLLPKVRFSSQICDLSKLLFKIIVQSYSSKLFLLPKVAHKIAPQSYSPT